ncbi:HNH endonuclease [Bradyrhizobium sp.]|uniref:HNH endonuclease n=1 Tax=Bradyrhizobium sp. TaxID=376 RepID=UPI003C53567F
MSEWIGKTPDASIPARVRLRVFERYGGRCHFSGRRIMAGEHWDCDHILALCNGGEHREANLAPILRGKPHKEKTAADVAEKSRVYRKRANHVGVKRKRRTIPGRKFDGTPIPARWIEG